ncbi:MAG: hypothetical protein ABIJ40_03480 [Bacteroidota bacterium]
MKTISKVSAEKKLQKLVSEKKLAKKSIVYGWINEMIAGEKEFRPVYSQGKSWKYSSLFDRRIEFSNILKLMGIEYVSGNDAPKGGRTGAYIRINTKIK